MKLSAEAKVAAAVTAGFMALTVGTITQGTRDSRAGEPNGYTPTNNPGVNAKIIQQGYDTVVPDRTDVEKSTTRPSLWVDPIRL
jgi:hypothetical protein